MSIQTQGKLNRLLQSIPSATVVTSRHLTGLGVSPQLAKKYVQNGWLTSFGTGAFARAGDAPDWLGGLYALQSQLGLTAHVAAVSALELQGRAHFVPLGQGRRVTLVSDRRENLPKWFTVYPWTAGLHHRCLTLFHQLPDQATLAFNCGTFSVHISSPERAIIEEMCLARGNNDIEHAVMLMNGLSTLRPSVVQPLLMSCTSVKAKRFFLWAAKAAQHTWLERVDVRSVDLGSGKRQLYTGGIFDPEYLITVPQGEELPNV